MGTGSKLMMTKCNNSHYSITPGVPVFQTGIFIEQVKKKFYAGINQPYFNTGRNL